MAAKVAPDVFTRFYERFGKAAHKRLQEPIGKAREGAKAGRFELAAGFYREALHLQPRNWVLLSELSQFLTFSLRDPKAGADIAKVALSLNPSCSAELWNALGDALYEFGRTEEAGSTYEKALSVNSTDVRARYNLAWVLSCTSGSTWVCVPDCRQRLNEATKLGEPRLRRAETVARNSGGVAKGTALLAATEKEFPAKGLAGNSRGVACKFPSGNWMGSCGDSAGTRPWNFLLATSSMGVQGGRLTIEVWKSMARPIR